MGNTADLAMVQKTITDTPHKEGKSQRVRGHRGAVQGVLYPSILNVKLTGTGLILLQLEQTIGSSGQRGTAPPTEPGFSQGFFSILSPMEFWFLAAVASGFLSSGHLISSKIIDLIAQILFKLN